jgi:hypothetical protein
MLPLSGPSFGHNRPTIAWPPAVTPKWTRTIAGEPLIIDIDTYKDFINRPREDTFWDQQIEGFILAAQKEIERICQIFLVASTWVGTIPYFYNHIRINKRPFISVTEIDYVDPCTGTITTVDPTLYMGLPIAQLCGMVYLGEELEWPDVARRMDAVRVTVTTGSAGFVDGEMPSEIIHAILMTTAAIDKDRGDEGGGGSSGRMPVYFARHPMGGGGMVPASARALLGDYILRSI